MISPRSRKFILIIIAVVLGMIYLPRWASLYFVAAGDRIDGTVKFEAVGEERASSKQVEQLSFWHPGWRKEGWSLLLPYKSFRFSRDKDFFAIVIPHEVLERHSDKPLDQWSFVCTDSHADVVLTSKDGGLVALLHVDRIGLPEDSSRSIEVRAKVDAIDLRLSFAIYRWTLWQLYLTDIPNAEFNEPPAGALLTE